MPERASLSPHHRELMLSLAYLGGLTYALALRLLPCYSERTLQRDLADLRQLGDVEKHPLYKPGPKGRPVKQCDVWSLTDKGHTYIAAKANDQYPLKPTKLRHRRVLSHDLLVVKAIVRLIELARPSDLSGLFIQFETRLNPDERRPVPDAVVIMQVSGGFGRADIVPWTKDPAIKDEHRWRFAIEADNGTETLSVIAGKARAYKAAFANPEWRSWWTGLFGPLPLIIWVVSNKEGSWKQAADRLLAIHRAWEPIWPEGAWIGTTEQYVEKNIWLRYIKQSMAWGNVQSFERPVAKAVALSGEPPRRKPTNITRSASATSTSEPGLTSTQLARPIERITARQTESAAETIARRDVVATHALPVGKQPLVEQRDPNQWSSTATHHTRVDIYGGAARYTHDPDAFVSTHSTTRLPTPAPTQRNFLDFLDFLDWWGIRWDVVLLDGVVYAFRFCSAPIRAVWKLLTLLKRMVTWLVSDMRYSWYFEDVRTFTVVVMLLFAIGGVVMMVHQVRAELLIAPVPTLPATVLPMTPKPPAQPMPTAPTPAPQPTTCGAAHVIPDGLNLRAAPGGAVRAVLYRDQEVVLLCGMQRVGATTWVHVRAAPHVGWVSERFLRPAGPGS